MNPRLAIDQREISPRWRTITSPRQQSFFDVMVKVSDWTEDDLQAAVAALPPTIRDRLAKGPVPRRYDCAACEAFKPFPDDFSGPTWEVFAYHEVPKLYLRRQDDLHYGPLANESYERTLAMYRAAGWSGEAPEADA